MCFDSTRCRQVLKVLRFYRAESAALLEVRGGAECEHSMLCMLGTLLLPSYQACYRLAYAPVLARARSCCPPGGGALQGAAQPATCKTDGRSYPAASQDVRHTAAEARAAADPERLRHMAHRWAVG